MIVSTLPNAPTLWQRCHNIGNKAVSMSVPMLWQHSNVDTLKRPSNFVWMSRQCCANDVWTLYFDQIPKVAITLSWHWAMSANIVTLFRQHCMNVVAMSLSMSWIDIETTFKQCCMNVVYTLVLNYETIFRQHCVNIAWMSVPNVGDQHWDNVVWMLSWCWCPTLYLDGLGPDWKLHSNLNFLHFCNINTHLYIGSITSTNIYE